MKSLLMTLTLLISTSAFANPFANPFDGFVGDYKVNGSPQITSDKPRWCNWFDFQNITGLTVAQDPKKSKQSHVLYIQSSQSHMELPITQSFSKTNLFGTRGSYAKISGSSTFALSTFGEWSTKQTETYTASLEKTEAGYLFKLTESIHDQAGLIAACYYQVILVRQ